MLKLPILDLYVYSIYFIVVITIPVACKTNDGKRIYDRSHACCYCGGFEEINQLNAMDVKTHLKERSFMLDRLRFQGDFYHNSKIFHTGGELIVFRRPRAGITFSHTLQVLLGIYMLRRNVAAHKKMPLWCV